MTTKLKGDGNGDDLIDCLWAKRKEESPMSREQIANALRPRVGRTLWTLKLHLWFYLAMLAATLVLQGVNLAGYRSNPAMMAVHAAVTALAAGSIAFGVHLVGRVGRLDRMDENLAQAVKGRLDFLRGSYEMWLWVCAAALLMLIWAITTMVDNAGGVYRINKPGVFVGTLLAVFLGGYGMLKGVHVQVLQELRAALEDLENQILERTAALDGLKERWRRWYRVLVIVLTLLLLLGIWLAVR